MRRSVPYRPAVRANFLLAFLPFTDVPSTAAAGGGQLYHSKAVLPVRCWLLDEAELAQRSVARYAKANSPLDPGLSGCPGHNLAHTEEMMREIASRCIAQSERGFASSRRRIHPAYSRCSKSLPAGQQRAHAWSSAAVRPKGKLVDGYSQAELNPAEGGSDVGCCNGRLNPSTFRISLLADWLQYFSKPPIEASVVRNFRRIELVIHTTGEVHG